MADRKNDDMVVVDIRELVLDYGEALVTSVIDKLILDSSILEDAGPFEDAPVVSVSEADRDPRGYSWTMDLTTPNTPANAEVHVKLRLREILLSVIPSGYGVDNFYVVSYNPSPHNTLIMKTYPYQTH